MRKKHAYYLLSYTSLTSYENEIQMIYTEKSVIVKGLSKILSTEDFFGEIFSQEAEITLSLIEEDALGVVDKIWRISVFPYINILLEDIDYTYWHELPDGDEIEVHFPTPIIANFGVNKTAMDKEIMYLWNLDETPLKLPHLNLSGSVSTTDIDVKHIFEGLKELSAEKPFEEWKVNVSVNKEIEVLLPALTEPPLPSDKETYYGFLGINFNGEFVSDSLEEYYGEEG